LVAADEDPVPTWPLIEREERCDEGLLLGAGNASEVAPEGNCLGSAREPIANFRSQLVPMSIAAILNPPLHRVVAHHASLSPLAAIRDVIPVVVRQSAIDALNGVPNSVMVAVSVFDVVAVGYISSASMWIHDLRWPSNDRPVISKCYATPSN
jgi:hypothetical protein